MAEVGLQTTFLEQPTMGRVMPDPATTTFVDNMRIPVHRWFRFSAGFSPVWVARVITEAARGRLGLRVLDPFAGSGTTLLAARTVGVASVGVEAHPFVARVAAAKLLCTSDPWAFHRHA